MLDDYQLLTSDKMIFLSQENQAQLAQILELLSLELTVLKNTQSLAEELTSLVEQLPNGKMGSDSSIEDDAHAPGKKTKE